MGRGQEFCWDELGVKLDLGVDLPSALGRLTRSSRLKMYVGRSSAYRWYFSQRARGVDLEKNKFLCVFFF